MHHSQRKYILLILIQLSRLFVILFSKITAYTPLILIAHHHIVGKCSGIGFSHRDGRINSLSHQCLQLGAHVFRGNGQLQLGCFLWGPELKALVEDDPKQLASSTPAGCQLRHQALVDASHADTSPR